MKYAVIGGGISGISIAKILQEGGNDIVVFEKENRPGGMIKCDRVNGSLFHRTGGHVFNTKRQDVMDWFWKYFDKEHEFTKALRNSVVSMEDGQIVPYPIENHAYMFSDEKLKSFISDLVVIAKEQGTKVPTNFEEFLRGRFGETLYQDYFQPYNYKVWRRDLSLVPLSWLEGKLPMPTVEEMIYNNINHVEERAFVHSSFFYPVKGGSQFLADRLATGLDIRYNQQIESVSKDGDKWTVAGESFDKVIFCGNIKQITSLLNGTIELGGYSKAIDELESHGTTAVFCEIDSNKYSWIYMPSRKHESHRIICTGNFASSNNSEGKMTATVEFTDEITKDEILKNLESIPFSPKYLAHHYEKYTYPIQQQSTREMISSLKGILEPNGFYLLGRFAEWEYYNMDVAIGAAKDLSKRLQ